MSALGYLLGTAYMFVDMVSEMEEKSKQRCNDLIDQYANLRNLPRKKKKKEKKRILLEYSIFSYNPLTGKTYDWAK